MKSQKSILAYLFILLTGFSVFFSNKRYEKAPVHAIEVSQASEGTEDSKDTKISESQESAALTRAGVKLVVYNFFESIPVFHFVISKIAEKNIPKPYFARVLGFSFHLEHLFFGIIAPNAP